MYNRTILAESEAGRVFERNEAKCYIGILRDPNVSKMYVYVSIDA